MARSTAAFVLRSGQGSDGSSFAVRSVVSYETEIVDLVSTGTVPVAVSGSAVLKLVVSGVVDVSTCSVAFVGGSCPAGATSRVLAHAAVLGTYGSTVSYTSSLTPGDVVHLRVQISGVYNEVSLSASATPTRGPMNRTAA